MHSGAQQLEDDGYDENDVNMGDTTYANNNNAALHGEVAYHKDLEDSSKSNSGTEAAVDVNQERNPEKSEIPTLKDGIKEVTPAKPEIAEIPAFEASPPTEAPTAEAPTAEAPPPAEAPTAEVPPPSEAPTVEAPPPAEAPTVEAPPPAEAPTAEAPLPIEAPTAEVPPPSEAPTVEAPPPAEAPTAEASPPTEAPTAEASPPTEAPTAEASPPTEAPTAEVPPPEEPREANEPLSEGPTADEAGVPPEVDHTNEGKLDEGSEEEEDLKDAEEPKITKTGRKSKKSKSKKGKKKGKSKGKKGNEIDTDESYERPAEQQLAKSLTHSESFADDLLSSQPMSENGKKEVDNVVKQFDESFQERLRSSHLFTSSSHEDSLAEDNKSSTDLLQTKKTDLSPEKNNENLVLESSKVNEPVAQKAEHDSFLDVSVQEQSSEQAVPAALSENASITSALGDKSQTEELPVKLQFPEKAEVSQEYQDGSHPISDLVRQQHGDNSADIKHMTAYVEVDDGRPGPDGEEGSRLYSNEDREGSDQEAQSKASPWKQMLEFFAG